MANDPLGSLKPEFRRRAAGGDALHAAQVIEGQNTSPDLDRGRVIPSRCAGWWSKRTGERPILQRSKKAQATRSELVGMVSQRALYDQARADLERAEGRASPFAREHLARSPRPLGP